MVNASAVDPYDRPESASTESASSARSLLISVLGTFVHPGGGSAWTTSLLSALALMGVSDGSSRQAIARAAQSGLLRSEKHGRRARWHLSDRAGEILSAGADRLYGFGQDPRPWDGRWLLLMASVPETHREVRYRLRNELTWAGFGQAGPGLWISPWPERETEARAALAGTGPELEARSFVAEHGQIGEMATMVSSAWDLASLAGAYRSFAERFAPARPTGFDTGFDTGHGAEAARDLLAMTHHWRWFPAHDPGLPLELLPAGWPGREAAEVFHRQRRAWTEPARAWWARCEEAAGPSSGPNGAGRAPVRS